MIDANATSMPVPNGVGLSNWQNEEPGLDGFEGFSGRDKELTRV